jgi:hypothetical protein
MPLLFFGVLPVHAEGQAREVVSNELSVSQREAALHLEFSDEGTLDIALRDGSVIIDEDVVGSYERADALDTAWRSLLGEIVSLVDGPLSEALRNWDAPPSLTSAESDLARMMDQALEEALSPTRARATSNVEPSVVVDATIPDLGVSLQALLSRSDLLGGLRDALEAVDLFNSRIQIGEDLLIPADETIAGTMVVIDADLTVEGRIEGDVVVVEGSIRVREGGQVTGDIRLVDSRYDGVDASSLDGRIIRIESDDADLGRLDELGDLEDLEERIREEVRGELRREFRGFTSFHTLARGVGDVVGDVMALLIIAMLALGVVYFAKDNLELVADTAQRSPMRAGMVGVAGAFLVLPTWLLGCVALVVSVVGIIALPFWLLLFPIAVALGAGLGYLAVARNIGEWVAAKEISGLEWMKPTNTFYAVVTGVGTLIAFSVASNILDILPFFGFFSGLLATLGAMATAATFLIGFGAVLLTRGGRQAEFYDDGADPFDEPSWREADVPEEVIDAEEVTEQADAGEADVAASTATDDESGSGTETGDSSNA